LQSSHSNNGDYDNKSSKTKHEIDNLARRECYYLYYEFKPTGAIVQQIFCRGTTLMEDVGTCLQMWMIYDDDCQCYVHKGFRDQANRILQDVIPLLIKSPRATIELCGHSLGGAVASILSIKLRNLGYNVVRLTTVGEPRFIRQSSNASLSSFLELLPKHQLRIENDTDFVPFLSPYCTKVGNKIWLTSDGTIRYVGVDTKHVEASSWTDSVFLNFRFPEIIWSNGFPHRIPSYVERLQSIVNEQQP
jgi:Lipase (class 3)